MEFPAVLRVFLIFGAIAFAIASEFCRKRPFARNFRSENEISVISFAKPFAFASEFLSNV